MIHSIIVEDDPMVAEINRQYLLRYEDFLVDAVLSTGKDALAYLRSKPVDLMLLDIYMPGISGSELLRMIRAEGIDCAVIMITAVTESEMIRDVLRLGVVDYLIKPYSLERFQQAIRKYHLKADLLSGGGSLGQREVDRLMGLRAEEPLFEDIPGKGLNQSTIEKLLDYLGTSEDGIHTCESLSEATGLSKVTVRRYLNYFIEKGRVSSATDYGTGGRPRILYSIKK